MHWKIGILSKIIMEIYSKLLLQMSMKGADTLKSTFVIL